MVMLADQVMLSHSRFPIHFDMSVRLANRKFVEELAHSLDIARSNY